jgi:hypothetical protein
LVASGSAVAESALVIFLTLLSLSKCAMQDMKHDMVGRLNQ